MAEAAEVCWKVGRYLEILCLLLLLPWHLMYCKMQLFGDRTWI